MFRLNRLTDYGVVVLAQMAQRQAGVHTAPQLSEATGVPLPTVAKILNCLARENLVNSQRGAAGGYVLERSAADISVAEIVQALEGPIALTACVDGSQISCDAESFCPMRGNWERVNRAIRSALSDVTLADMAVDFAPLDRPSVAARAPSAAS